jgi:hypothetical protein
MKESIKTRKEMRQKAEEEARKEGETVYYPSWDDLRLEDREEKPVLIFTVTDAHGEVVRQITTKPQKGIHRITWDLHYPSPDPASTTPWSPRRPWSTPPRGPLVAPGTYTVQMAKRVEGVTTPLGTPQSFEATPLGLATLPAEDWQDLVVFQRETAELHGAIQGAIRTLGEAQTRIDHIQVALRAAPGTSAELVDRARALELRLADLRIALQGDRTISSRNEPTPRSLRSRVGEITWGSWGSTSAPTQTHRETLAIAEDEFQAVLAQLTELVERDLAALERDAEAAGAPWTPGRLPRWPK